MPPRRLRYPRAGGVGEVQAFDGRPLHLQRTAIDGANCSGGCASRHQVRVVAGRAGQRTGRHFPQLFRLQRQSARTLPQELCGARRGHESAAASAASTAGRDAAGEFPEDVV